MVMSAGNLNAGWRAVHARAGVWNQNALARRGAQGMRAITRADMPSLMAGCS